MYTGTSADCASGTCVLKPRTALKCRVLFLQNLCLDQRSWQSSNLMLLCMFRSLKEALLLFGRYQLIIFFLRDQIGSECSCGVGSFRETCCSKELVLYVISSFTWF